MNGNETVVNILSVLDGPGIFINLNYAPGDIDHASALYAFDSAASEQAFLSMQHPPLAADAVKYAGSQLFAALAQHPAIHDAMMTALTISQENVAPLYIYLRADSDQIEGLPWETLYSPNRAFLALDTRWPIARIAGISIEQEIERTFTPPLKIMVILAAAGVDATVEWKRLYEALGNSRDLQLQVLVCQPDLKTEIEQSGDQRVTVQCIIEKSDLLSVIGAFDPHLLHFFCHGSTEGGAHLQIATCADWVAQNLAGSIAVAKEEFQPFSSKERNIWLVALNCCEGAAASTDAYSLARALVAQGFPAVIGTREILATDDAHLFCKAFYSAIVQEVEQWEKSDQKVIAVEWAKFLWQPRIQLCDQHGGNQPRLTAAAASKEWTLPVIYVRPEDFKIRVSPTTSAHSERSTQEKEALTAELKSLQDFKAASPSIPQSIINEIEKRINELERKLQ